MPDRDSFFVEKSVAFYAYEKGYNGIHCALYLADILEQEHLLSNGSTDNLFLYGIKGCEERTGLSPYQQRKAASVLKDAGVLSFVRKGVPPRNYAKINHYAILEIRKNANMEEV